MILVLGVVGVAILLLLVVQIAVDVALNHALAGAKVPIASFDPDLRRSRPGRANIFRFDIIICIQSILSDYIIGSWI